MPNVLWSALSLTPLVVFCYAYLSRPALYGLLGLSMLGFALPRRWFRYWQLSPRPGPYRRLGVPLANYLTQHGGLVNRLLRQRYPQYRRGTSRQARAGLWRASYHLEQFHLVGLVFFLGVSSYAAAHGYWGLGRAARPAQRGLQSLPYLVATVPTAAARPHPGPSSPGANPGTLTPALA